MVKNPPANLGDAGDAGSIPGSVRSPGGGNDNPLQYSCLDNSMGREVWLANVHGARKESDATEHTVPTADHHADFSRDKDKPHRCFTLRE